MKQPDPTILLLLDAVDEAFNVRSWHGTNLRGSLRGLNPAQAVWRPSPGRHNIAELVVHAAYWKYAVRRILTEDGRGSFPLKGSNWFLRDDPDPNAWRRDVELLADQHRQLRAAVAATSPAHLRRLSPKRKFTYAGLIRGVAAHDLYHAGQIQLLKRLRPTSPPGDAPLPR